MAAIRPARCYTKLKRPYTRVAIHVPRKSYVKGVPGSKIVHFEQGDPRATFSGKAYLSAKRGVQIRHNALEAARINANKYLVDNLGQMGYFLKILTVPYHVMRENAMATGAGADRLQQGMRRSFGTPVGFAARVKVGQNIILVRYPKGKESVITEALKRASSKLPTPCHIEFERA